MKLVWMLTNTGVIFILRVMFSIDSLDIILLGGRFSDDYRVELFARMGLSGYYGV